MHLTDAWESVFALGFVLATGLAPWLLRYAHGLHARCSSFVLAQAMLVLGSALQPKLFALVPALCLMPIVCLNEQVRFLCQPQGHDRKLMLSYIGVQLGGTLLLMVAPPPVAYLLGGVLSLASLAAVIALIYTRELLQRTHIQLMLICSLLITTGNLLLLMRTFWHLDSMLVFDLALLSVMASVVTNQWAIYQYTLYQPLPPSERDSLPPAEPYASEQQQVLQGLSHDMRIPLSGVLGMAELLLETPLSPAQREYAQTIQSSGNALLHLLNDRLDVASPQGQNLTILEEVFDVAELLNYVLDLFKSQADDKGIELISSLDAALPRQVVGDAVRLRQILSRLAHNAVRFTSAGEVVIRIRHTPVGDEPGIQFSVQDTGRGLSPDALAEVFNPEAVREHHGSLSAWHIGPDLATCAQLVSAMGGELQLTSPNQRGVTAVFTLPLKTPNSVFAESTTEFMAAFADKRLLVVDDNRTLSKVLAEQATQWGMRVSSAESGTEALALARNAANLGQPFDVIIMDYQMPGMSGLQLGARLKEDSLITNDVILIMLTGLRQNNIQTLARNAGIHRVISKPVTNKQLRQTISQELKRLQGASRPKLDSENGQLGRIKVLVAEDNQLSQKVIRGMMQKLGVDHLLVNNGREAVQAVMREHFDLVLMDCDMPFVDGYTATQEIRRWEREERRQPLPILALTAHILDEQKEKALVAGMNEHLSKPLELGDLQSALLRWS